ncbi:hypothetical protein SAY87_010947 [Trapa incisa]|uniref:Uncharacterized protein n=1 Tax=Trapa incisa TaxID=236973 RepID=A0AAN7GEX3_9MYRT|nr:hypothetical protein SAY87_010947 [Trapa incisa]
MRRGGVLVMSATGVFEVDEEGDAVMAADKGGEPENAMFPRIRMGNPEIQGAVREVRRGFELLEFVGFGLREEGANVGSDGSSMRGMSGFG